MRALRLFARLVVALLALTCVSKPHERTCGVYAHSNITNEPEFVEECLAAFLEPLAFSCQGARVHGPLALPGGGNGTTATTAATTAALRQPGITTRVLLGAVFQYCTDDGVTRPVRVLVPPTTTGSLVAAAAKAITDAFADFPYRRRPLITNFTQPASLRAYEDEVLRAAADRASALLHAIAASPPEAEDGANGSSASHSSNISPIPSYDAIFMTYATMQDLRAAQAVTGLAEISSMDQLFERQDIHPALLGLVTYADELSAVPLDGSQLLLYVRRDVLAAAGAAAAGGAGGSSSGGGGLRVPDTWEQLLEVAAVTNGLQADQLRATVNATGGVAYEPARAAVAGFCFPPSPRVLGDLALAVLASLVQLSGPQQGMYLNPDTLQPATATAAMPYVLSYLRRLAAYSAPVAPSARAPQFSNDFALGRCTMTVGTAAQFRRNSHAAHPAGPSAVIGRVTAALLPGSEFVVTDVERDWTSAGVIDSWVSGNNSGAGVLRPCDARLCPASQLSAGSASSVAALGLAAPPPSGASQGTVSTSSQALVNRAPLMSPGGTVGGVYGNNAEVMPQLYTWTMLSALGGPVNSWQLLLLPVSELGPWRLSHMDTADNALARWRAAGYNAADTASFLTAARATLDHHNVVLPLRVRTAMLHVRAVRTAALQLLNATAATPWVLQPAGSPATGAGTGGDGTGATASSGGRRAALQAAADNLIAMQQPQQEQLDQGLLEGLLASLAGLYGYGPTGSVAGTSSGAANSTNSSSDVPTREQMMQEYRRSLGLPYTPVTTTAGEVQSDNDSGSNLPVGAVVGAVVGGVLVAALAGVVALRGMRNRGRRRGRWHVVEPPGASPDTVLLVTDIEGSTSLWEALPEEVMDRALRTHHVTVRTVGIFFGAYESATEGDSFILAFASAPDAAQFALGLQRALLAARWPEELLAVPGCAPVYVRKLDWLAKANQVSLVPAPTRRLGSRPVRSRSRGADASGGGPRSLRFPSRNIAAVLGVFAGHPRARPHLQHAPTSKRSVGSAHAAEASAGLALPPAPGGFSRTGSAPPGHGPGLAGLGAGLLSRRWTSRRTSNDQAAIAAAMAAEEAAAQEGEGQGAAPQEEDGMGPTAEEEELDAEVAAAVEAATAAADPSQHGRATGGAAAGNRHLLGRFWAAMDAGGRPMQPMTSMRRRRRRSDTSLVAMMAAPYLERQSVPGHGDDQGDGGAGTPGGTGTGPGAAITDGTRKRSLRKFAMHGRQSVNVRGSPDLHVWSPGAGGGPLGGAVSLPTSPDDNPDNSMYGGRGTPRVGDGGRRARLKSIHHASVTFAAVAVAAISGSRAHDTGGGGGGGGAGASSDSPHRPGRIRRASLAISNLLGIGSGATSGPGSPASTGVADAVSGPDMALTPRQLSRHARRGSVLNTMLGTVTALGSPAAPGTGMGSAAPAAGTTDGGLTFAGATAAGVEGTGDAAPAALITCGSAAPPTAAASGSPHSRRLRRASLALTSWLGLGHPGNAASGSHTQVVTGSTAVLLPVRSRRASSDAIGATTSAAYHAIPAAVALMPASKSAAGKAAPTDLVRPSPTGAPTDARYPAGAVGTEAADSPHAHINSYSVVALSAALAASEYKAAAVAGADSTQLTGSIVDLPEPLTNSGLGHPSNASGPRARLLAGRALPGSGLPAEEVPPDALAAAAASPILTPAAPSPQATAASSGVQPPLSQARGRRASSFVPRLLNLALFEVVNGSSGGGGGPISTSGSGGGNAPRSLKSQGSQMRRRYSTVLERALSPRGKSMAGNSAAAAAVSGGGSGGGGLSDAATPEQAAVPGVSTWGSELGVEDGAEKWAELKWQMSGRRTGTVDAPAISSGGPRAFGGGAGATSGTTSRHSNLLTSSAAVAAGAAIAASSSTRPKLDIARVFSIAHMQDSSLPIAGRTSAANTGTTVVGAGSVRGGPDGTGGIDGLDFGRASPVPALSGGASPLFPPGLPPAFQDAVGIAATEGQQGPERKLAAAAAGLGLPSMSEPQGRSSADSGELPTRRTAPDMPHVEQLLDTPLQHSHSQPVRQHPYPPREQHHQQERRVGPPQLPSASTRLPAPVSGAPSPMPPSQQSRTGAVSAMGFSETADAALADERWSFVGVIIGTGGASGQAASSSSHTAGATPPMVSAEPAQPRARNSAVPLSLLLPANSSAPGVAGILSSAGGESLQLALRGSVGGGAETSACTASVPLPQRPARTFGPVFSPQPPAGSSGGSNALRQAVAAGGSGVLPLALQLQVQQGGAQQSPAGSPSRSQLQQAQPVRSSVEAGPLARLLARTQAPPPLLPVSPRHTSPQVPGAASPGHRNPASSATNPNTPSSAAACALSAARSSTSSAAAAAALHRRFSELAVELAKPVARARSQAGSGGTTRIAPPDQMASPRRGGFSITAGGSGMKPAPATLDRSHTFNTAGGEAAAAGGGSGGAGEGSGGGGATAALAAVVAGALKFGSFSRRSVSSGPRVLLPRSQHGQHFLTASGGADSTGSNGSGNAAAQSLPDGTQSATLPHLSASGAAAAAASQSGGSSRMARLEYTSSRRRVGAGMEPLERLEEETGGAPAQTVPLPQAQPQSPSASPLRKPPPRLRSSGAVVAGTSADGNEPGLQPSAAPETGRLTPKGARGKSDGGGGGGEARVSKSGILPSALQLLLKRSGTGGSSRKAGLSHLSDAASTESADLLSGEDGSGHGRVPKSPARQQLAPRSAERDVPSAAFAPRLDLVEMTSDAGGANARPSGAGEAFGSAIVPLAEPPRAHSAGAGGVGVAAGSAALGFVKPSIIIPLEDPSMAALPQPFAHDQPALMSPDATAAAASVSFAALDTATSNIGPGPQHTEPLHTAPTNGVGRVGSITTHVPAARAVKPPTHGSLLELLHRVFVRVDGAEAAEGHKQRQNNQQHQQQRPADMQLVFAGLRVRVGLHCGVTDARDIQYNAATARMTFSGEGLRIAKAVCDCASGGQVVMSGEVLLRLQLAGSGGVLLLQQQQMLLQGQTHVLDLGDHQLLEAPAPQPHVPSPAAPPPEGAAGVTGAGLAHAHQHNPAASAAEPSAMVPVSRHLLCIAAPALLGRMAVIPPVRSALHQFTPGFMDAPVGPAVCVVVFRVSNAAALAAWNAAVASEAMALLELYLRASLGALINTSNTSGSNTDQAQPAESLGLQSSGRGGAASTPNRLACYLAAAPPGSPFGTFVAGFSQPAAAARWALTAVARTAELPWPAELLESQWGRPLEEVTRAEAEAADAAAAAAGGGGGNTLPYAFGSGAGTTANSPGGASSFMHGGGSPPRGGAFSAIGGSVGSRMARLLRTAPGGWISSPLSLASHKGSGRHGSGTAADRGADSSPLVSGTVLLSLPPPARGGGAGVVVGGPVSGTEASSAACTEMGGWAPVEMELEDDVELGEPSTAGADLVDQPESQHSAVAAVGAGGSGRMRGVPTPAAGSAASKPLPLPMQSHYDGHAPSATAAAAMSSWDAVRKDGMLPPAAEGYGGGLVIDLASAGVPAGTTDAPGAASGAASTVSAQLPPMPVGRGAGPAAVRTSGFVSPVRGLGLRTVLGGGSSAGGNGVMRSGGSASRVPMPSRFALAAEAAEPAPGAATHAPAPTATPMSTLARAVAPTAAVIAVIQNSEIVVVVEPELAGKGQAGAAAAAEGVSLAQTQQAPPRAAAGVPAYRAGFPRSSEALPAPAALPITRALRPTHMSENGAEGLPPAEMVAAGSASGLGLSGLPPGARRMPSATGPAPPTQRLRNRLLQHLTLSFTSLSRKAMGGSPVAGSRFGAGSGAGDVMDLQGSAQEMGSAAGSGERPRTMSGPMHLHSPGEWPVTGTSGRGGARGMAGAASAVTPTPKPALGAAGLPSGAGSAVTGAGLEEAMAAAAAAARAAEDAEVVSFRGLRVRLGMAVGPVRVELCPLTGRVVYSGKTVTTAMTSAASARLGTLLANQGVAEAIAAAQGGAGLMLHFPSGYHSSRQGSNRHETTRQDSSASHATAAPAPAASGPWRKAMFRRAQTVADEASAHAATVERRGTVAAQVATAAAGPESQVLDSGSILTSIKRHSGASGEAIQRARTASIASPERCAEPAPRQHNAPASSSSSQRRNSGGSSSLPSMSAAADMRPGAAAALSSAAIPTTLREADDEVACGGEGAQGYDSTAWATCTEPGELRGGGNGAGGTEASAHAGNNDTGGAVEEECAATVDDSHEHGTRTEDEQEDAEVHGPSSQAAAQPQLLCTPAVGGGLGVAFGGGGGGGLAMPRLNPKNPTFRVRLQLVPPATKQPQPGTQAFTPAPELAVIRDGA